MHHDPCQQLWTHKVLIHLWDIRTVTFPYIGRKRVVKTRVSDLLEALYFYREDPEFYTMCVDYSGLSHELTFERFEAVLVASEPACRAFLEQQLGIYKRRRDNGTVARLAEMEEYELCIQEIEVGLSILEEYRGIKLTGRQTNLLIQLDDIKKLFSVLK